MPPSAGLVLRIFFPMSWVALSLLSALFVSLRYLYIKRFCRRIPAAALVLTTRTFGAILLAPAALAQGLEIGHPPAFHPALVVTVLLTMVATIWTVGLVQRDPLSASVPYLSFIPIFMIPWTVVLFGQIPGPVSLGGIALACTGAYLLNMDRGMSPVAPIKALAKQGSARMMLLVAVLLGCTTALDRIAIRSSSALTYTVIWTVASAVVTAAFVAARSGWRSAAAGLLSLHAFVQAALWVVAFYAQMAAVQQAIDIPSGVTYVKTVTMLNIVLTVVAGGRLFGEKAVLRNAVASALMVAGAAVVALWR